MLQPYWNCNAPYNTSHRSFFDFLNESELAQHIEFINDDIINPDINTPEINARKIQECIDATHRLPILTFDNNPYPGVEQYLDELDKYIDPTSYFVFSSDSRKNVSTRDNVAPFPTWLIRQHQTNTPAPLGNKKYRISFLSGVARYHRIELFRKIKPYIRDNDVVVINKFCPAHFFNTIPTGVNVTDYLTDLPWESFAGLIDTDQSEISAVGQHSITHPAYQACVNITGETNVDNNVVLFSEKTWKAYIAGCLVVNFGVDTLSTELKKLGFEIWDEYDIAGTVNQRTEKIIEMFHRNDLEHVYNSNIEMIRHNQNLVSNMSFVKLQAESALGKIRALL